MQENPYGAMLREIKGFLNQGETQVFTFGTVLSPAPLRVEVAGQALSGNDLMVNPQLLEHAVKKIELGELKGALIGEPPVSVTDGQLKGKAKLGTVLEAGDLVFLFCLPEGRYFVMSKVMKAPK